MGVMQLSTSRGTVQVGAQPTDLTDPAKEVRPRLLDVDAVERLVTGANCTVQPPTATQWS